MTRNALTIVGAVLLLAGLASADTFNANRPLPLGDNGFEDNLQEVLDGITVGGPGIDALNDQISAALFQNDASGGSVATFIIELTSGASSQTFGIYDAADSTNQVEVFAGAAGGGSQALISFFANGDIAVNFVVKGNFASGLFGFYLDGVGGTFFSEDSLNPGGNAQAVIYQGDDATVLEIPPLAAGTFSDNEFIIAFEDVAYASSDKDFQDFVALVESISIPEPSLVALLGVAGLALVRRRRRRK